LVGEKTSRMDHVWNRTAAEVACSSAFARACRLKRNLVDSG
jgi:hypothetical protein